MHQVTAAGTPLHDLLALRPGDHQVLHAALEEARRRTWLLADGFTDADLRAPATDYLSPPAWDLGHIGNFEELWLVQRVGGLAELRPGYNDTYDAFKHPRIERPKLKLLDRAGAKQYQAEVRQHALAILHDTDTGPDAPRLTRDGFVYWMLILHEHQHDETLLQSIALRAETYQARRTRKLPDAPEGFAVPSLHSPEAWVDVAAGSFMMGYAPDPGTYDNECPPHPQRLGAFQLMRYPVTCGQYRQFIDSGGYEESRYWSRAGRAYLDAGAPHHPLHWRARGGAWWRRSVLDDAPVRDDEVLSHVNAHEADAFARWAGARLPSEAEWEYAARSRAAAGEKRDDAENGDARSPSNNPPNPSGDPRNPWGNGPAHPGIANIDQLGWGPAAAGAYPAGASSCGAEQMIGDVWEWTASDFSGYPGFEAFPYAEYSEVFFDQNLRVLRGGSWASRAGVAHGTFRNWDLPIRQQIFAGIRLARGPVD